MTRRAVLLLGLLVPFLPAAPASAVLPTRGYVEVACGFDMNRNGVRGEAADCNVGDGVTTDPDGDGDAEDIYYVDCAGGTDNATCGTAGSPCLTIDYAFNTRADGPGVGFEDIVAFKGTCTPDEITITGAGITGTYTLTKSGSEEIDWLLPDNPSMLIGWDDDNDGNYPPWDTDDTAILEGTGFIAPFNHTGDTANYFEAAHFTAQNYGRTGAGVAGRFWDIRTDYTYLHDISLLNINRDQVGESNRIVWRMFNATDVQYFYTRNIECLDCGGFYHRGAGSYTAADTGPFRFQNHHWTARGCSFGSSSECDAQPFGMVAKLWGNISKVAIIDGIFDGAPANRSFGTNPSQWPQGVTVAQCARGFQIRNNEFINISAVVKIQPFASGDCDNANARTVTDVLAEQNIATITTAKYAAFFMELSGGGNSAGETSEDITFVNNSVVASGSGKMAGCLVSASDATGITVPGTVIFSNNTCSGPIGGSPPHAGIKLRDTGATNLETFTIENNIFSSMESGDDNVDFEYAPTALTSDHNVFDEIADYVWVSTTDTTLGAYQTTSSQDANSKECDPTMLGDGYHLNSSDTCAKEAGLDGTAWTTVDTDGDTRTVTWDIGADEVSLAVDDSGGYLRVP